MKPIARGRLTLAPNDELQIYMEDQALIFALRNYNGAIDAFGQPILPEQTYIVLPNSFISLASFTGAEIEVLGE